MLEFLLKNSHTINHLILIALHNILQYKASNFKRKQREMYFHPIPSLGRWENWGLRKLNVFAQGHAAASSRRGATRSLSLLIFFHRPDYVSLN